MYICRSPFKCSSGTCTSAGVPPNVQVEHVRVAGHADVRVEHAHLPDTFRCSSGTCTLADPHQMFMWNMYAWQFLQMVEWNMLTYQVPSDVQVEHVHLPASLQMFEWIMLTGRIPSDVPSGTWTSDSIPQDVPLEHGHLLASFKCSNGTCTPSGFLQMFKWNMYAWRGPTDVRAEHGHIPQTLQMFKWNMYE